MELHYRRRFFPRKQFLGTYSSQKSSVARQCVDAVFLGPHYDDRADLKPTTGPPTKMLALHDRIMDMTVILSVGTAYGVQKAGETE